MILSFACKQTAKLFADERPVNTTTRVIFFTSALSRRTTAYGIDINPTRDQPPHAAFAMADPGSVVAALNPSKPIGGGPQLPFTPWPLRTPHA